MTYFRVWLLFLKVMFRYGLFPQGTNAFYLAGKTLFSLSYRMSEKNNKSSYFFVKAFITAIKAKKITHNDACHIYSPGRTFFYDNFYSERNENERLSHINYFLKRPINGSIWKPFLLGYFNFSDKLLQLVFETLLFIILLPVSIFSKYAGSVGLIFWEYVELVNLLKLLKENKITSLYYYSIYEKDSNIAAIAIQQMGVRVLKITSSTPIKYWNSIIVGTDTLILCDTFQVEELESYPSTIQVKNIELWGPETIAESAKFYTEKNKYNINKNVIGFYSSASYLRAMHGDLDEWNMEKNEYEVKKYLVEYIIAHPRIKLVVFPHPREKKPEYKNEVLNHYHSVFKGIDYSINDSSLYSSQCFDSVDLGVAMYSSVIYERLYFGFKSLMMPFGEKGLVIPGKTLKNICAVDKKDFFAKIDLFLTLTVEGYFSKTGLKHSVFQLTLENPAPNKIEMPFYTRVHSGAKNLNIAIVDYGLGNLASIQNMLRRLGYNSIITSNAKEIHSADKLILPGVGAFAKGMDNLKKLGLIDVLNRKVIISKAPVLGICLGMELMTSHSEEGNADGLGWVPVQTQKFVFEESSKLPIPHMGWTEVAFNPNHWLFKNVARNSRYYFAHSYFVTKDNPYSIATANYGFRFTCAFANENIAGVQFHPEKSHHFGLSILYNFITN